MMTDTPRNPKDKILTNKAMYGIAFSGSVNGLTAYIAFLIMYLSTHNYEKSITITFVAIIFGQYANLLSRRTFGNALGKYLFSNYYLLAAFGLSISCILLIVYIPICNLYFHTAPLHFVDWLLPISSGAICLLVFELLKKWKIATNKLKAKS